MFALRLATCAVALALFAHPAAADVYRWTDENGRTHFDDDVAHIPAAQRDSARVYQMKAPPADAATKSDGPTQGDKSGGKPPQ